jgi:polysaccharide biosynthesis/export protein
MTVSFPSKSTAKEHVVKNLNRAAVFALLVVAAGTHTGAQTAAPQAQAHATPPSVAAPAPAAPAGVAVPSGYVIGPDDVLMVLFWREKDMSLEVTVRPDGRITLPLLNDVQAAGLTPEELRAQVMKASAKYVEDPNVTVLVKTINSRKVFITGMVAKPGPYPLSGPTTVMQLLSMAGGIQEFADSKNIIVMRTENGRPMAYRFNYTEVVKRRNLRQNIELKPGDTVIVP